MSRRAAHRFTCFVTALCVVTVLTVEEGASRDDDCRLLQEKKDQAASSVGTTWHVTDAFLDKHDLQYAIDCASNGDVIVLSASRTVRPRKQLEITKWLTIRRDRPAEEGMKTEDNAKTTLTCPSNEPLLLIENASVVLKDIVIQGCSFSKDDSVDDIIDVKCDASTDEVSVFEMSNVDFVNNSNPAGSVGISVRHPTCVSVSMDSVSFSGNTFLRGSLFAQKNDLKDIGLFENIQIWSSSPNGFQDVANQDTMRFPEGRKNTPTTSRFTDNPLLYALLRFPESSTTTLVNVTAEKNKGELISVEKATLTMKGRSSFSGNVLEAVGGAMIIAYGSTVHFSGVLFQSNEYRNQSSGVSMHQGSSGTIDDLRFVENHVISGSCISATHFKELQIHSSIFESNVVANGVVVFVEGKDHDLKPTLNITHTSFTKNLRSFSRNGPGDGVQLIISGFDSGRVSLHSTTFSLNTYAWFWFSIASGGGGLSVGSSQNVNFTMTNCTFQESRISSRSQMYVDSSSGEFLISESRFLKNSGSGAGRLICFNNSNGGPSNLRITNSVFQGNSGTKHNVCIIGAKSVHLERSNFTDNSAIFEGIALYVESTNFFESHDCYIANNYLRPTDKGGTKSGAFLFQTVHSIVLKSSVFYNNSGGVGGGIRIESNGDNSELLVESCRFLKNKAHYVGGLYANDCTLAVVRNSTFLENSSDQTYGGLQLTGSDKMLVESCTFGKNEAIHGGGLRLGAFRDAEIMNSAFYENSATTFGGAVFVGNGRSFFHQVKMRNLTFENNSAEIGGAICSREYDGFGLYESSFVRNRATLYGGAVALVRLPGPRSHYLKTHFYFKSLSFVENSATYGGAMFIDDSESAYKPNNHYPVMPKDALRNAPAPQANGNMKFFGNHAEIAGGAVFAEYPGYIEKLELKCSPLLSAYYGGADSKISSLHTVECEEAEGNTVGDGGYGQTLATPSVGFFATLIFGNGTNQSLPEGGSCDLGAWKSGGELPSLQITAYDSFGQGMARTRSPTEKIAIVVARQTPYPSYDSSVMALLHSEDTLFQNDLVGDMTNGKGSIAMGSPLVEPGNYSADLEIERISAGHITFMVTARECKINEYPREDNKECLECDQKHYNFNPVNGTCTICPADADCNGTYVLPDPGNWNSFPCSHKIHPCLHEEACLGVSATYKDSLQTDETKTDTCDLSDEIVEKYQEAICDKGYTSVLCGACIEKYAKVGLSQCQKCRNHFLIVLAIAAALVLLTYSSTEQIGGNLDNVRSRWLRRMERMRTLPTEAAISEAMNRAEIDQEYIGVAQKAKERFVLVLQIMLNFLQSIAAVKTIDFKWSKEIGQLLTAWDWISGTMSKASTFSFECLLPAHGSTPRSVVQTVLTVIIPFSVTTAISSFWAFRTLRRRMPWKYFVKRCVLTAVSVLYVSYLSLVETAINVFYCIEVFDEVTLENIDISHSYWVADTSVRCFTGSHRILAYVLAVPLLVFVLVYPLVLAIVIVVANKRGTLRSDWIQTTLGVLMNGFKTEFAYWDCTILLRKALIATVIVFAYKFGVVLQGTLLTGIFVSALFLQYVFHPYQTNLGPLNFLEALSLFVCGTTVMSGIILSDSNTTSDFAKLCLLVYVFASNLVAFSFFGYHLLTNKFTEIKSTLLCEGVDVASGDPTAVLMSYVRHKTEKVRNLSWKMTTTLSSFNRRLATEEAVGSTSSESLLPSISSD